MKDTIKIAELLFPQVTVTPEELEARYPERGLKEGARVTRFAPSPTGFLHIGGLYAALAAYLTAEKSGGVFYLRIEDTDKKREIEDGVSEIIAGLNAFDIEIKEGRLSQTEEIGAYGPYLQSERKEIYQCFAKELVKQGLAYPCFCTPEELEAIREAQEQAGVNKGYYGEWAKGRELDDDTIIRSLKAGKPWTLRLRSDGGESRKMFFDDIIKGKIEMPENIMDVVLLKTDGIPTYHFAHCIDDHLMRTTHIVRGDEWIASMPIHVQLFRTCGFKVPKYAHIAPIMKEEDGGKRKLSKRKDPEAAVTYYAQQGYPAQSVIEYLLTLANSNFEEWRKANPNALQSEFPFNLKKMSASGALFDLVKLDDVSKNVISRLSAEDVYKQTSAWAASQNPALYTLLTRDETYAVNILSIDRGGKKPRKDLAKWDDIAGYVAYFYEETYQNTYDLPDNLTGKQAADIAAQYLTVYDAADDKDVWFQKIKDICAPLGYTPNVKEYKQNPEQYLGHVGDVSGVIRIAVTGRRNTPDLCAIMKLLGAEQVKTRLEQAMEVWGNGTE